MLHAPSPTRALANQVNKRLRRADHYVFLGCGAVHMDRSPYAIEKMANGSFVVMKVLTRTPQSLAGRDVKLNAFRGSFATREEAEREVDRLVAVRQLTQVDRVA